jgi:hypothetical protein
MDVDAAYKNALQMLEDQRAHMQALARKENENLDPDPASQKRRTMELLRRDTCIILQELWGPRLTNNASNHQPLQNKDEPIPLVVEHYVA